MALVYCTQCGHQISTIAARCPSCGAPGPGRYRILRRLRLTTHREPRPSQPASAPQPVPAPPSRELSESESGIITAHAVLGLVFGLIAMLGSFIPYLGTLAFRIGIFAALISGPALAITYARRTKHTFAINALTISLVAVVISLAQLKYFATHGGGTKEGSAKEDGGSTTPVVSESVADPKTPDDEYWDYNVPDQNGEEISYLCYALSPTRISAIMILWQFSRLSTTENRTYSRNRSFFNSSSSLKSTQGSRFCRKRRYFELSSAITKAHVLEVEQYDFAKRGFPISWSDDFDNVFLPTSVPHVQLANVNDFVFYPMRDINQARQLNTDIINGYA